MKEPILTRLQRALNRADIAPHIQREVIYDFSNDKSDAWGALLARVRHARNMMMTNKSRWLPHIAPFYQEYTDIMSVVSNKIEQARIEVDADGTPISLASYTAIRAAANRRRLKEGKRPLAACGDKWQDWIPAHVRADFTNRVDAHYAQLAVDDSVTLRGAKFTPFITRELKREDAQRVKRIDTALKNLRRAMANCGTSPPMADNLMGALYLAAVRQAERALVGYRKRPVTLDNLCPVNWMHLLEPRVRARVNVVMRADREGRVYDIPLEWCRDFYFAPQPGHEGEDYAVIRDMQATRELAQEIETAGIDDGDIPLEDEEHS